MTVLSSNQEQPKKILLVEDDQILRDLYVELLTSEGYNVEHAADGEQGLKKIRKGGYDLVLLNVMLPKIDALKILAELRKKPSKKQNKKIVLLTNLSMETIFRKVRREINGYLVKSELTPEEFLKRVMEYLK